MESSCLLTLLHLVDVPLLAVLDCDRVKHKFVLVAVIIVLIHLVVGIAFWRADSVFGYSRQDDMNEFDVQRAHQETEKSVVNGLVATIVVG